MLMGEMIALGRCGNAASILEISPGGRRYFNVFYAAPENERDGPNQAEAQAAKVSLPRSTLCIPVLMVLFR